MWPRLAVALALASPACARSPAARLDTLVLSLPYEPDTLDPQFTLTISNFAVAAQFYEPLIRTDAELKAQPCLARSWETRDPLTWVFHLQPGVRFHSGRPLHAADVVYSLRRLIDQRRQLLMGFGVGNIVEVEALDPDTVRLRTRVATSLLPNQLNFALVVPEGATAESLAHDVDGTGPYRLVERSGQSVRMARNEGYWGRRPDLARVELLLARSPEQAIRDLQTGRAGFVQGNSRRMEEVARGLAGVQLKRHESMFVKYLGYDLAREATPYCGVRPNPFRKLAVRQAIDRALDREALVRRLPGLAVAASQLVPRFVFGFDPEILRPLPDRDAALALLRQAGLPGGFEVTLHARSILEPAARVVAEQLLEAGLRIRLEVVEDGRFMREVSRGDYSFFLSRYGSPTGDAGDVLDDVFHSPDPERGYGSRNWMGFASEGADAAIEAASGQTDNPRRRAALQRAMSALMHELPWVPLYTDEDLYAFDRRLAWTPRADSYVLAREIAVRSE
jgi:peptide/nickel transport system substrate-binding protein